MSIEGYIAFIGGEGLRDNPYCELTQAIAWKRWRENWLKAYQEETKHHIEFELKDE